MSLVSVSELKDLRGTTTLKVKTGHIDLLRGILRYLVSKSGSHRELYASFFNGTMQVLTYPTTFGMTVMTIS